MNLEDFPSRSLDEDTSLDRTVAQSGLTMRAQEQERRRLLEAKFSAAEAPFQSGVLGEISGPDSSVG